MEWAKNNLALIIMFLTIFASVLALNDRYATSKDLVRLEQQVVKTLEDHRKANARDKLEQRYDYLGDSLIKQKSLMRQYPNDVEIKEDYNSTVKEREKVKEQLDKLRDQ